MRLCEWLATEKGITAVIGSGGKTTLLRCLGEELRGSGTVLLCTTTKVFPWADLPCLVSPAEEEVAAALREYGLICAGTLLPETGKLGPLNIPMARLAALADFVLVEADGSAQRPLKAHASHEPVIPPESGQVLCVVGASGLNRPIREAAHRPDLYAALAGIPEDAPASPEAAAQVLRAEGLAGRYYINQAEGERRTPAKKLAGLLDRPVCFGSLQRGEWECLQ